VKPERHRLECGEREPPIRLDRQQVSDLPLGVRDGEVGLRRTSRIHADNSWPADWSSPAFVDI
jgi:hypothetical protein